MTSEDIMFSSNDTPSEEFVKAKELGAYINLDDISHIDYLESMPGFRKLSASGTILVPLKEEML